jgi:hypothetical protein
MRIFWAAAAAAILVCGIARAEGGGQPPESGDPAVGIGIICNTPEEAKQVVDLRSRGAGPEQAIHAVNAKATDERACGVAAIAYMRGETIDTMTLDNNLVQIVRVNIVAGFNGSVWQRVSNTVQYAVLEGGGQSV